MYINFKMLESRELDFTDLLLLQAARQQKSEDLSHIVEKFSDARINSLLNRSLITRIKGKKKDSEARKIRVTGKGKEILENIETPEIEEQDLRMFDWMADVYTRQGKEIGNKKKTKMYIALFRAHSGIEKNHLATLLEKFVNDEANMEYNYKLEFAFFKPATAYQVRFDLEQSRLYQYYLNNKAEIDLLFDQIELQRA